VSDCDSSACPVARRTCPALAKYLPVVLISWSQYTGLSCLHWPTCVPRIHHGQYWRSGWHKVHSRLFTLLIDDKLITAADRCCHVVTERTPTHTLHASRRPPDSEQNDRPYCTVSVKPRSHFHIGPQFWRHCVLPWFTHSLKDQLACSLLSLLLYCSNINNKLINTILTMQSPHSRLRSFTTRFKLCHFEKSFQLKTAYSPDFHSHIFFSEFHANGLFARPSVALCYGVKTSNGCHIICSQAEKSTICQCWHQNQSCIITFHCLVDPSFCISPY